MIPGTSLALWYGCILLPIFKKIACVLFILQKVKIFCQYVKFILLL